MPTEIITIISLVILLFVNSSKINKLKNEIEEIKERLRRKNI